MTNQTADIVVVGGGVIGTSIAMHLALMGSGQVTLVEQGHLAGGATGLSGAMVREHYLHPVLVNMAMEGPVGIPKLWRNHRRRLGFQIHRPVAVIP